MKKIIATGLVTVITATSALAAIAPANAQSFQFSFGQRNQVVDRYCSSHSRDNDCRDYRRGHWSNNDYNRFYRGHRSGLDSLASGLFGFTFGAIIGGAIASANDGNDGYTRGHVARCEARFRSYDERTDTYLGFDGDRHACTL